jgi:hypothetical protein
MKVRTVLYVIFFVLAGVLVAANWELLVRPTEINLVISTATVPGILIAMFLVGTVLLVDWAFHLATRSEWRHQRRELTMRNEQLQADLNRATDERQQDLHRLIERESARLRAQLEELRQQVVPARPGEHEQSRAPIRARTG